MKICKNQKPQILTSKVSEVRKYCRECWSGDLMIASCEDSQAPNASDIYSRSIRKMKIRIPVRKRNSKTSQPSKTVTDSRGKPRARRWCWNRRRRQEGVTNRRFVVYGWRILYLSSSWSTSFELLRHRKSNIPGHIEIRRRIETNSDETYYQSSTVQSEGCCFSWRVDWDYNIPNPAHKTSWKIQVAKWKINENPKCNQTRQHLAWTVDKILTEKIGEWAE